jgi:hypothetical protein
MGPPVTTLRRLATSPAPRLVAAWRLELLAGAALVGGIIGRVTGAY